METIERNAFAQAQSVEELLDMSRIINGKLRLEVQPVDLPAVVSEAIESFVPPPKQKAFASLRFSIRWAYRSPATQAASSRFSGTFFPIQSNSLGVMGGSRSPFGGVNIHVEITVADSGQGIPADFLPHPVHPLLASRDVRGRAGTGDRDWDLALVKSLVELHGGTVKASSPGRQSSRHVLSCPCL